MSKIINLKKSKAPLFINDNYNHNNRLVFYMGTEKTLLYEIFKENERYSSLYNVILIAEKSHLGCKSFIRLCTLNELINNIL